MRIKRLFQATAYLKGKEGVVFSLFCLLFSLNCEAQQVFKLKESIQLDIGVKEDMGYYIKHIYADDLYLFYQIYDDRYFEPEKNYMLYKVNLITYSADSFIINIPENKMTMGLSKLGVIVCDLLIDENNLYLNLYGGIVCFKYKKNQFRYSKSILIKDFMSFGGSRIAFYDERELLIFDQILQSEKQNAHISKIRMNKGWMEHVMEYNIAGSIFGPIGNQLCDVNDRFILVSSSTEYKIYIYDKKRFALIDSVIFDKKGFKENPAIPDSFYFSGKQSIAELKAMNEDFNRILKCMFISDSAFVTVHLKRDEEDYAFLDMWELKGNKWVMTMEDGKIINSVANDNVVLFNDNYNRIGFTASPNMVFYKQQIIKVSKIHIDHNYFYGKTFKDYVECWKKESLDPDCYKHINHQKEGLEFYEFIQQEHD